MLVRFSIDCDMRHQTANAVLMQERAEKLRQIERDLTALTGRECDIWDDAQMTRIQFTFTEKE